MTSKTVKEDDAVMKDLYGEAAKITGRTRSEVKASCISLFYGLYCPDGLTEDELIELIVNWVGKLKDKE